MVVFSMLKVRGSRLPFVRLGRSCVRLLMDVVGKRLCCERAVQLFLMFARHLGSGYTIYEVMRKWFTTRVFAMEFFLNPWGCFRTREDAV